MQETVRGEEKWKRSDSNLSSECIDIFPTNHLHTHLQDDILDLSAQSATPLAVRGVHELVGGKALAGHTVFAGQHPNDDIWDTVLGLVN